MFDKRSDLVRFLAVTEAGAITLAADRLAVTQPALTRVVARLEHQFGGRLFERTSAGVHLTALGRIVAEQSRKILCEIETAERRVNDTRRGRTGSFRVTACPMWSSAVMPESVARFHEDFPSIDLKLESASRTQGLRLLADGRSDLHCGGIDSGERLSASLRSEDFIELTAGIVAGADHPLLSREVTVDDLVRFPWIDFASPAADASDADGPSLSGLLAELFERTAIRVRTVVSTGSAGLFLMTTGRCLSWLPLTFLDRLPGLALQPLPVSFGQHSYRSGFVARRSAEDLAPLRRFEAIVRETALRRSGQ